MTDPQYEGVRNTLRHLKNLKRYDLDRIDVTAVTEQSRDYWRALIEMTPGNQLISSLLLFLNVANGDFDRIFRLTRFVARFSSDTAIADFYIRELKFRLSMFYDKINTRIKDGIARNDDGDYAGAIAAYQAVLSDYPGSAWATYEQFYSKMLQSGASNIDDWAEIKKKGFGSDTGGTLINRAD